jgi:hypothetical protein
MSFAKDKSKFNIAAMARDAAPLAIRKLMQAMEGDDMRCAIDAAKQILDRAIGKPVAMTADVTDRLEELTDDEIMNAIDIIRGQASASVGKARATSRVKTVTH